MPSLGRGLLAFRAREVDMWRPDEVTQTLPGRKARQAPFLCALAVAAIAAVWSWGLECEAFVNGIVGRPAGNVLIVDELPRGLTCRNANIQFTPTVHRRNSAEYAPAEPAEILEYGSRKREEWSPLPQWRGEKTYHPSKELQGDQYRQWYHFDAERKTLGHLAQAVALTLRGKNSPLYDPIRDVGAYAIITNCDRVRVSGKKYHYKLYLRNLSKRPGHMKVERFKDLLKRFPERILMRAVWGMLPKTKSSKRIFKERLKLFAGPNHLYYDKDPVEYPMHTIKDCTASSNIRHRDRLEVRLTARKEREAVVAAWNQRAEDRKKLFAYKRFLENQLKRGGDEVKDMSLQDFAQKAEKDRMRRTLVATEGMDIPKKKVKVFWKTYIPVKRYSGNKGQKKDFFRKLRIPGPPGETGPQFPESK